MPAKTRDQLRVLVRTQLDMDTEELPDATIDPWLDDGYERTLQLESRWPFLQTSWDITTVNSQVAYTKASLAAAHPSAYAIDQIVSVLDVTASPFTLAALSHDAAEQTFGLGAGGSGVPAAWSEWGGSIHLWQAPAAARTVRVRGFRVPAWGSAGTAIVDADARLHVAIFYFACGLAYAQQEDEVLMSQYMAEWDRSIRRAHEKIMAAPQRRPVILSGTNPQRYL